MAIGAIGDTHRNRNTRFGFGGCPQSKIGGRSDEAFADVQDRRGLPIAETMALMKAARLHVRFDSFTNHVTNILPLTPAVIVWGPTSSASFGNWAIGDTHRNRISCFGCGGCPLLSFFFLCKSRDRASRAASINAPWPCRLNRCPPKAFALRLVA